MNNSGQQTGDIGGLGGIINQYLSIHGSGGGSPMHKVGTEGIRQGGWGIGGQAEARIPIDQLIKDALLRLQMGGHGYGGKVEFPKHMQENYGLPPSEVYGGGGIDNLGVGFSKGGFSSGLKFNPQTGSKSINAKYKINF